VEINVTRSYQKPGRRYQMMRRPFSL